MQPGSPSAPASLSVAPALLFLPVAQFAAIVSHSLGNLSCQSCLLPATAKICLSLFAEARTHPSSTFYIRMPVSSSKPTPGHRSPVCLVAGRLELHFHWQIDRWAHRLLSDGQVYWQSIEGAPAIDAPGSRGISPNWPASPVFTEVSLIDTATGPAVLAVGRAGRSHFSASMAAAQAEPDTIVAELACRLQELPGWLGSTYQPLPVAGREPPAADWLAIRPPAMAQQRLPATITWSYLLAPTGIQVTPPASCEPFPFRSN